MNKVSAKCTSALLFRIGRKSTIEQQFKEGYITFGCPANWIDYSIKHKDSQTGDLYECIIGQTLQCDPRVEELGKTYHNNLLQMNHPNNGLCLVRFIPTILTPTLCFYSFNTDSERNAQRLKGKTGDVVTYNLDRYRRRMGYAEEEASFLFIEDKDSFVNDLRSNVPIAVEQNKNNLTSERVFGRFHPKKPLLINDVDYSRHTKDEIFVDNPMSSQEIFWKMPEYAYQHEMRFIIPGTNFIQSYDSLYGYNPTKNVINVHLPHLKEYALVYPASEAHTIRFSEFNDSDKTMKFSILSIPEKELL